MSHSPLTPDPFSRRRSWLSFFWGGTALMGLALALLCVMFALGDPDPDGPLGLCGLFAFAFGGTMRRTATRTVRSVERGEELKADRFGPRLTAVFERRMPFPHPPSLGTAAPEPGLRHHMAIGNTALAAMAAATVLALLILVTD